MSHIAFTTPFCLRAPLSERAVLRPRRSRARAPAGSPASSRSPLLARASLPAARSAALLSLGAAAPFLRPLRAGAVSAADALAGPLFAPLAPGEEAWVRALVWGDFRVAVALFVVSPMVLFLWSFWGRAESDAVKRILVGYWQGSSLLMLTVFLNIAEVPVASFMGLFVQGVIAGSLLWWKDLLEEVEGDDGALATAFRAWRGPAVAAAVGGVVVQVPFQGCNFEGNVRGNAFCAPWLEPPLAFHDLLIPGVGVEVLQGIAYAGMAVYFGYLVWLLSNVLPRCGRSGRKDRNTFSSVSALKFFGLIDKDSPGN